MSKLIAFSIMAAAAMPAFAELAVPVPAALPLLLIGGLAAVGVKLLKK